MRVIKRNGDCENVSFDKVLTRISLLSSDLNVNVYELAQKVCSRIFDGVKTSQLDELAAQMCSSLIVEHPDYGKLASKIIISNHHKNTSPSFSETIEILFKNTDRHGNTHPLVNERIYSIVMNNKQKFNSYIDYSRDYDFDYFGFKTMEKAYLQKVNNTVVERPQHMFLRVSLGIHNEDIKEVLQTYDYMSQRYFVHATPTLFNSGTNCQQNSSCYLICMSDDSINGIYDTLKDCANVSKYAGGIGLNIHNVRGNSSQIRGTNGTSTGIIPMLRVFNATARYVNQSGKRNGSIAVFLEPWHCDLMSFLDLRKNHGNEEDRTRDLFLALWIPDLFMKRVQNNDIWSFMCPDTCKGLQDVYGDEFETLYLKYESEGKYVQQVNAQDVWFKILESQIETGVPYMGYKDNTNRKTNQSNLGTIKSLNLCMEIAQVSKPDEIAVCNLASICLPSFVNVDKKEFDFKRLHEVTKVITKNLNKVIDVNFYPVDKAKKSNLQHRPIGIGVQGLADAFIQMRLPFESAEAKQLNKDIFETMYHGALEQSMEISKKRAEGYDCTFNLYEQNLKFKGSYASFEGSPASKGILQFDMWNIQPSDRYDWDGLKESIKEHGLRNSLLIAPMPTASTSQIMGFNECFEPLTSNLYKRKTIAGEYIVINRYLINDLIKLNIWNNDMKEKIIINEGSIQNINEIPQDIRELYKTVWEIKQKNIIEMATDRGAYICQSQSMNIYMEYPELTKLSTMHFYAWSKGLKTGLYYLRSKAKAKTQQFTIDPRRNNEVCESCSA